ncbi:MAG: EamA family transporter [bacterium]|nr:EamA family transporter [bacterium]
MRKGYFLVFLTALISGFAVFINKFGVSVVNPNIYTFLKVLTVAIFLTGLLLFLKDWRRLKNLTGKQWLLLITIGLIGGSIPFLLFFKGLSLTNAAQGSFIHKTMFIWVALLAILFLKEKINKKFLFGGLFLLLGSLILLKKLPYSLNQGDLLVLLATLFWAAENTISKYVLRDLEGVIVAWARMFFGALFILIFLSATNQLPLISGLTLGQINWVLITAVILFGYVMTWYSGLKFIPVSQATVILLLGSPITTLLSLIAGGKINPQEIFSGILIIFGIIFVIGFKKTWQLIKETKKLTYARN